MALLRGIGSLLVIFACGGIGAFYGDEVKRRLEEMKEMRNAFLLMRGDVRYMRSSLPEAFASAAKRSGGMWQQFFEEIAVTLEAYRTTDFSEAFHGALQRVRGESALRQPELALLSEFGGMLGRMDQEMQMNAFEWFLEQSERRIIELSEQAERKVLLSKSLGVIAGLFLVVILL